MANLVERLRGIPIPADEELLEAADVIERLQAENKTLFEEHRIAMNLLRENTATLESVAAERDRWKQAYEDAKSLAALAIQRS
jgi:hypothetical protein